jgi:hypothetical protein
LKVTFMSNAYSWSAWVLDAFEKNLFNWKKEAEEKRNSEDNSGVLGFSKMLIEGETVEWLLYLNLIEGEKDLHYAALEERLNPSLVNWDDYIFSLYTKSEQLKKYKILHAVQDFFFCELGERKKNERYFFIHWTKNKKEVPRDIINYCFSWEEKATSRLKNSIVKDGKKLLKRWTNMLREGMLLFADFRSRDWFIEQVRKLH